MDGLAGTGAPKVVRVIARLNVGGPAQHVVHLSAGMAEHFPTLLVAGPVDAGEADMSDLAREKGVELRWLPELGRSVRPLQDLVALVKLYRLFRRTRPLVVHTHTAKAGTLGRVAAFLARVPVRVHTFHGHVFHGYFGPIATRLTILTEQILARITTRIVAISDLQARDLADEFQICARERIQVVPLGLDLSPYRPAAIAPLRGQFRAELGTGQIPIVSIVGRVVPIKNHELFVRMAADLVARGVEARFVVVGGGSEEPRVRALVEDLGLSEHFHFLGWRRDLARIYADSDLVVLTSSNEGTPVCLIEALAAGCAVVATEVGGVADVLANGRFGVLCPDGDIQGLANAVARLLDDPAERRNLGSRGAELIPERFGVGRLVKEMETLYERLLAGPDLSPAAESPSNPSEYTCTTS